MCRFLSFKAMTAVRLVLFLMLALAGVEAFAGDTLACAPSGRGSQEGDACPVVRIVPDRLPDMTVARSGHSIFYAGGELTVVGGHTSHFVPVPTAEYYADGKWHQLPMAYSHDNGFAVVLRSGEVLIGGGHAEELGVGQTYTLERYNPAQHTFEGFGCLDRRRVLANATETGDGRVIISGNHYAADAISCYNGNSQVEPVKGVRQERSNPYVLPMGDDDALILGGNDIYDNHPDTAWVDRVKGEAFRVPLLEQWRPVYTDQPFSSEACSIGKDTYLLTVVDPGGQMGIVMVRDTSFSLLPTVCPIPMKSQWGPVFYKGPIVIDRERQRGYVMGVDSQYHRQYILTVDYAQRPAALTLYHTDSIECATITIPVVTPDGDLILAGGIPNDNYKPLSTVWLYHFGTASQQTAARTPFWIWAVIALMVIFALAYLYYNRRRKNKTVADVPVVEDTPSDDKTAELMERICRLMDEEQLYLRNDLKLQDVAVRLSTNSSYVSECINSVRGQSFSQFVNTYRIRHAQELLRRQPDAKAAIVATESGFSTESSFFRNFKAVTGMTPREWLGSQQ